MQKTWLITGATRGIGLSLAKQVLKRGDNLVATARNTATIAELFSEYGDQFVCATVDVHSGTQIEDAVNTAVERFNRIDVLVNNAGFGQLGYFETIASEAIERQFHTNVFGLMHMTRAVLPIMRQHASGYIINLSSIGGVVGFEGASIYCASKFAVEGFSESLSHELKEFGIDVTILEPGFFRTDFLESSSVRYGELNLVSYQNQTQAQKMQYDQYSLAQLGDPDRLAKLVVDTAHSSDRPLRLLAGSDALFMARESLRSRSELVESMAAVSLSTDYPKGESL